MTVILFNPLSNNGKNIGLAKKLANNYAKNGETVKVLDILEIGEVHTFLNGFTKEDKIIILGGDGTIHRIANKIYGVEILPEVYIYKAGTGNDFIRSVPVNKKLALVKPYLKKLPSYTLNNEKNLFINGVGLGLDGMVCYKVNASKSLKNKANYFKNAFKSFIEAKRFDATITVDGQEMLFKKVWFASIMNSKYFGGGMKIAPTKKRGSNDLELVVVRGLPKYLLILLFPLIYVGLHRFIFGAVKFIRGREIIIETNDALYLQVDGEDHFPVSKVSAKI